MSVRSREKDRLRKEQKPRWITSRFVEINERGYFKVKRVSLKVPETATLKNCLACGMCCGIDQILGPNDDDIPVEWTRVNPDTGKLDMKRGPNGRCILQDPATNECTVYNDPRKPKTCNEFQRGSHRFCYTGLENAVVSLTDAEQSSKPEPPVVEQEEQSLTE